jgi:uncharacterized membrane protein YqjE
MDDGLHTLMDFLGSFRTLGDGLLAVVQDRLALLALEIEEERDRLLRTFVWLFALVFTGTMAVLFGSFTLVYLYWETARLGVLGGLALFYLLAFGLTALCFRRFLARQTRPFASTLQELGADRQCLRTEDS